MADRAYITPEVLKWARESAKMPLEKASLKISVTAEKLKEWEDGITFPTIKQAQKLAQIYKRPFALFFLPEIPREFQPLQDFRIKGSKELSTSSIFIIREIQQKQNWIKELYEDNNEEPLSFVGKFSLNDAPSAVADNILKTLSITPGRYKNDNPIKDWISAAETNRIFVSRTSFIHSRLLLDSEELQGFVIADSLAPFIFINSDDWNASQLFTLVHELAHIWINATGLSNRIEADFQKENRIHPVELFCNDTAAHALIPQELISNKPAWFWNNLKEINKAAKLLGVSSLAYIVRAYKLNFIARPVYENIKREAELEYNAFLQKLSQKKDEVKIGIPDYFLLQLNRNSRLFTQTVLDAYRGGIIEPALASGLLNIKANKFDKLEAQLYK